MKQIKYLCLGGLAVLILGCHSCNTKNNNAVISILPEAGTTYNAGTAVNIKVSLPADVKADSIVYLLDSVKFAARKDTGTMVLKTDTLKLGSKLLTARVYTGAANTETSTNIVLLAARPPQILTFKIDKVYPHDTACYTEGLQYVDGYLYESAGLEGHSNLRKVDLATGKVLKQAKMDAQYFGEGIAVTGDKIVQFTYKSKVGFVYDKNTFKILSKFTNNVGLEGWGVGYDGKKLYFDDSSNRIFFLDKNDYHQVGFIDVYDDKKQIDAVNELEYIDGKLYANVYQTNDILVIDPKTGAVLQKVDMTNLWPQKDRPASFDSADCVLNGIAWDAQGKRLFVTGKKWPHLYQVTFLK